MIITCCFKSVDVAIFRKKTLIKGSELCQSDVKEIRFRVDYTFITAIVLTETSGAKKRKNIYKPASIKKK